MCVLSAVGLLTGRVHGSQVTDIRLGVCIIWKFNCVCVLNPLLGVWECVFVGAYETWSVCDYVTARAHLSQNMCVCLQVCLRSCVCDRVHVIICTWLWGCDGVCPADSAPCVWERHGVGAVGWAGGSREMHCEQTAGVTEKGLKADLRAVLYAMLSRSVMSDSLCPHGLYPARLFCSWGFSRQEHWTWGQSALLREFLPRHRDTRIMAADRCGPRELDLCSSPSIFLPSFSGPEHSAALPSLSWGGGDIWRVLLKQEGHSAGQRGLGALPEDVRPFWTVQLGNCGSDTLWQLRGKCSGVVFAYLSPSSVCPTSHLSPHQSIPSTHACPWLLCRDCTSSVSGICHMPAVQ